MCMFVTSVCQNICLFFSFALKQRAELLSHMQMYGEWRARQLYVSLRVSVCSLACSVLLYAVLCTPHMHTREKRNMCIDAKFAWFDASLSVSQSVVEIDAGGWHITTHKQTNKHSHTTHIFNSVYLFLTVLLVVFSSLLTEIQRASHKHWLFIVGSIQNSILLSNLLLWLAESSHSVCVCVIRNDHCIGGV